MYWAAVGTLKRITGSEEDLLAGLWNYKKVYPIEISNAESEFIMTAAICKKTRP